MSDELRMGIYRHYKGTLYQVLGIAHDANAEEYSDTVKQVRSRFMAAHMSHLMPDAVSESRTVVVYMPLQLDGAHLGPRMAVRTLDDFVMHVTAHGEPTHHDLGVARFTYLGPVLTVEMLRPAASTPESERLAKRSQINSDGYDDQVQR